MDFTSIIGLILGLGLIVFGIVFSDSGFVFSEIGNFISYSSMAITFGGAIAATIISFPPSYFKMIPKHLKVIVRKNNYKPKEYIGKIVEFAQEARKKGLLSLEDKANQESDPFLKNSIMLIVDAIDPAKVKEMLENELNCLEDRHSHGWQFYEKFASYGPAFGMIGTLIGLINMLKHMDMSASDGATKMAQGMSVALITTFYGSLLANMVLVPIAHKLHMCHDEEMTCKELIVEGVLAIQAGENPTHIEQRLNAYLSEGNRQSGSGAPAENEEKKSKSKKVKKAS